MLRFSEITKQGYKMKSIIVYILGFTFLVLTMLVKYHGLPHEAYAQLVGEVFRSENTDSILRDSFLGRHTVYFTLLKILHLDIRIYEVGLAFHIVLSLLALACVVFILRWDLGIYDPALIILSIAVIAFADNRILPCTYAGPVMGLAGTPAAVAHALSFLVILLILRQRYYWAAVVFTAACAFNPRGIFVLYPILAGGILLNSMSSWPAVLIPGIWGAIQYSGLESVSIAEIIQRDGSESHIPLIEWRRLLAFMLVFPLFAILNKYNPAQFRRTGELVLWTSLAVFCGGWVYQTWIYQKFPLPEVWLLSPVRGMSCLVLFVHLSLVRLICIRVPAVRREFVLGMLAFAYLIGIGYPLAWIATGFLAIMPVTPFTAASLCIIVLILQLARMEKGPRIYPVLSNYDQAHTWGQINK